MTEAPITGFVLAGGHARRMGTDKASLPWGNPPGTTLLEHMVNLVSGVTPAVHVVGRETLPDLTPGRGPLEGIRTALHRTRTEDNLIVAVDLPFLDSEFLRNLAQREMAASDLLLCRAENLAALCLRVRIALLPQVEKYLDSGRRSLQGFAEAVDHIEISEGELGQMGFEATIFRNINTQQDYHRERQT